jgi:hypothetical protein
VRNATRLRRDAHAHGAKYSSPPGRERASRHELDLQSVDHSLALVDERVAVIVQQSDLDRNIVEEGERGRPLESIGLFFGDSRSSRV